jgi:HEAT repeat protein
MYNKRTVVIILAVGLFAVGTGFGETIEKNWDNFLHYTQIGRLDMAKGCAQAILQDQNDPEKLFTLSQKNTQSLQIIQRAHQGADAELAELSGKLIKVIEQGSFIRRTDQAVIIAEIKRLNSTERGRLTAIQRLKNAGEYAIPLMLEALSDPERKDEAANIALALPKIEKDAIRPLTAALQTSDRILKTQIIEALGQIGYEHTLPYLKYIMENDSSQEVRNAARNSITKINPSAVDTSAAQLFYRSAEQYYNHTQSLAPAIDTDFANIWFWDTETKKLVREEVAKEYFYELMAMRNCEWALKSDANFGSAIALWIAAYFKAESAGIGTMPEYFGKDHPDASMYATTAGVEYLHQGLARAIKDKNSFIALGIIEALGTTAGEKSLFYRIGTEQPLIQALTFNDRMVRYSAAIAIASACPKDNFAESKLVVTNLAEALAQDTKTGSNNTNDKLWNDKIAANYALRSVTAMLELAKTHNPVIDLSAAMDTLIKAGNSDNTEIQILSSQVLSYLANPLAQQAIATLAMDTNKDSEVRIAAFSSLATSAKLNANLLTDKLIDDIYKLIQAQDTDSEIRDAAATAYGALNLPSRKVKDLILDQAKS